MKSNMAALFMAMTLSSCASMSGPSFKQGGSDALTGSALPGKAVVVIATEAEFQGVGPMLVAFAKLDSGATQQELYSSMDWEFATYPGAVIPFYSGQDPYVIRAYALEPGRYAAVRCVWQAPEVEYCPSGTWTSEGRPAGMAYFDVAAGDVVNVGRLHVTRIKESFGTPSRFAVSVENNMDEAKAYMREAHSTLADELVFRPMQFAD